MCIDSAEKVIKDYEYPELSNLDFFPGCSCPMVGSSVSRSSSSGWNIWAEDRVLRSWVYKTLYSYSASVHPGI